MSENNHFQVTPPGPSDPFDLETGADKLALLHTLWMQYGDCYRVHSETRGQATWVLNDPNLIKPVLVSRHRNYAKGVGIERVRVLLGNGLMASEGDLWRSQRRMLQAAFHRRKIESMLPIYIAQAQVLQRAWRQAAAERVAVDVTTAVSHTTLRVVLEALLSEDLQRIEADGESPFNLVSEESERNLQFAMRFRQLGKLIQAIAAARRQAGRFPEDILSHMLLARDKSSGSAMSDRQLIDEALTLIVAGHETTAASLNWLWFLLAAHPETMDRVCAEARAVDFEDLATLEPLQRLEWIPWVIKEALRLYPPGWLYTRRALHEDRLGPYTVPAGTDLFICSYLLHRHPAYWEQPDEFQPQRFAPAQEVRRHRYAYLPFAAGPRHCIGENFAMIEMMIHLGVLARELRPRAITKQAPAFETDVNLRPREPLHLDFEYRDTRHA